MDLRYGLLVSRSELKSLQLARLRVLISFAYENVPYFRKLFDSVGFQPRHLKRLFDMGAIPVTTRERLQAARQEELIARGYSIDRLRRAAPPARP